MSNDLKIIQGNALDVLRSMEVESVQCVVTSPPYYGLRWYKTTPQIWGGDADCDHKFGETLSNPKADKRSPELKLSQGTSVGTNVASLHWSNGDMGSFCLSCHAWRGELGLEPDFNLYIDHLIEIFAEVRRVLKNDGVCFVNLGDSYGTNSGNAPCISTGGKPTKSKEGDQTRYQNPFVQKPNSLHKSLLNIPGRFAIAMTDKLGFIQRNEIIWFKRACMPSSAKDRFTVDFEPIFFFAKNPKYKFNQLIEPLADSTAADKPLVRNDITDNRPNRDFVGSASKGSGMLKPTSRPERGYPGGVPSRSGGENIPTGEFRNKRCVWDVPFEPSKDPHFASYPTKLVEPLILSGSDESDVVLDIFAGTGTTLLTALRNRRTALGIELNPEYIEIAKRRLSTVQVNLI